MAPVLEVANLSTHIDLSHSTVQAVGDVSLRLSAGETLGIVGESGCGKSMTALSIMGLLPTGGSIVGGSITLDGRELVGLAEPDMRKIRGNEIAMVFQDPLTSLDPTKTIGYQVAEGVRLHRDVNKASALDRAAEVLSLVGLPRPKERLDDYPHQLSGGLRQRVMIAIALACEPKVLIADEPTTALDVTIQAQILRLLSDLKDRLGMAMLLITHDMGVVAGHTDRINVMYAGRVVESTDTSTLFSRMRHPYTQALLASIPRLNQDAAQTLYSVPGIPPDLSNPPHGCRFAARCAHATQRCRDNEPELSGLSRAHVFACWHPVNGPLDMSSAMLADRAGLSDAAGVPHVAGPGFAADALPGVAGVGGAKAGSLSGVAGAGGRDVDNATGADVAGSARGGFDGAGASDVSVAGDRGADLGVVGVAHGGDAGISGDDGSRGDVTGARLRADTARAVDRPVLTAPAGRALLKVDGLVKEFPITQGILQRATGSVKAVSGVSFEIGSGATFGLVGESGCGKTTIGRMIVALETPSAGTVTLGGEQISAMRGRELRRRRRDLQMMFQDPYASLDPRMRVGEILREPLVIQGIGSRRQRDARVLDLLGEVGLPRTAMERYPHEFSGGQRQRIGLARALTLNPQVIVADEPVSALDVSIRAQVLNLMKRLQKLHDLTYVVISHDLAVVKYMADRIGVMYLGKLVEMGSGDDIYRHAAHPYTAGLIATIPIPDPAIEQRKKDPVIEGELPSPANPPSGCRFRTRCRYAQEICAVEEPPLRPFGPDHVAACHFPLQEPVTATPQEPALAVA